MYLTFNFTVSNVKILRFTFITGIDTAILSDFPKNSIAPLFQDKQM